MSEGALKENAQVKLGWFDAYFRLVYSGWEWWNPHVMARRFGV